MAVILTVLFICVWLTDLSGTTDGYRMTTDTSVCPEGFSHMMRQGKQDNSIGVTHSCYKFIRATVDRGTAAGMCKRLGSGLVSIETQEEQTNIERMLRKLNIRGDTWTSGYDWRLEGKWRWTTSGYDINFGSWAPGQPDKSFGDDWCLHLWGHHGYKWDDGRCFWKLNLLCERDVVYG